MGEAAARFTEETDIKTYKRNVADYDESAAGRLGEPEEIARWVVFLASDDVDFINGSTIAANGAQFFA